MKIGTTYATDKTTVEELNAVVAEAGSEDVVIVGLPSLAGPNDTVQLILTLGEWGAKIALLAASIYATAAITEAGKTDPLMGVIRDKRNAAFLKLCDILSKSRDRGNSAVLAIDTGFRNMGIDVTRFSKEETVKAANLLSQLAKPILDYREKLQNIPDTNFHIDLNKDMSEAVFIGNDWASLTIQGYIRGGEQSVTLFQITFRPSDAPGGPPIVEPNDEAKLLVG